MNTTSIVVTAVATLIGGAFGAFLNNKLGHRKQDEIEFSSLIKEYRELVTDYKADVQSLRQELLVIKVELVNKDREIVELRNQLMIFESSHADIPLALWLKDTSGKMLYLNDEYEQSILYPINKSRKDYIGQTDFSIWGKELAKVMRTHDKMVMREKKPVEVEENWVDSNGNKWRGKIIKFPRFLNRKTVIGIGGAIIDKWLIKDTLEKVKRKGDISE